MRKLLLSLCFAIAVDGADDPWAKVRALKSGTDLRIYKKGVSQPLNVKMGDLTDDNLVVINKNEQVAIARDAISRIDARPIGKQRVTTETKVSTKDVTGDPKAAIPAPGSSGAGSTTSTSTGFTVGSKNDFETVYRRPPPDTKKK